MFVKEPVASLRISFTAEAHLPTDREIAEGVFRMNTIRRNQSKVTTWLALIIRRRVRGGGAARGLVGVLIAGMVAFASVSEAAIGIDNVSTGTGNGSSITVSHTTAGTNRLMLVGISGWTFLGTPVVSGVTYNSVALSLVGSQGSASFKMWIYGLVAPDTGTHDVVVTFSTAPNNGGVVGVETFTGVNQSTPLGTFGSASGNGTTATVDVSSATGELVFDTLGSRWTVTAGAGQTQRWNASSSFTTGSGSTEPGATTVTMSWGISQTDDWAIGAVPIKPAPTGAKIATLNHNAGEFAVGYPHQRKVLRDASGYWYVAYMDYNGSTSKYEIYLTKSTNTAGTSWATPVKIAGENGIVYNESTYDFRYPAIDIDRTNGRLHLVFNKAITVGSGLDDHLVYSRCTNLSNWNLAASWTQISGGTSPRYDAIQTTVYVAADPIYAPSIAINSSGNVHIGYITPPGTYYRAYHVYGTTSWGSPVEVSTTPATSWPIRPSRSVPTTGCTLRGLSPAQPGRTPPSQPLVLRGGAV